VSVHPPPSPDPEAVKKLHSIVSPVKTGVQGICDSQKTLDSGFRRNDVEQHGINLFAVPLPLRDCVGMSLRGSETTETISQCLEDKEIAALPSRCASPYAASGRSQ
jgi:hypothetical protein